MDKPTIQKVEIRMTRPDGRVMVANVVPPIWAPWAADKMGAAPSGRSPLPKMIEGEVQKKITIPKGAKGRDNDQDALVIANGADGTCWAVPYVGFVREELEGKEPPMGAFLTFTYLGLATTAKGRQVAKGLVAREDAK